ncbi:molecular chaperone TorD family protein [Desulfovibrio aminophilus]|uniref:TorD/DmsD family molecular chaperone n=1 Tax=Desulfovibrio aminophilus TaxID=81425 RepID=UPI00339B975A
MTCRAADPVFLDALLGGLQSLFWGPTPDRWPDLAQGFRELARAASDDPRLGSPLQALAEAFPEPLTPAEADGLSAAHVALFVSAKGGVPAPPYHSCHDGGPRRVLGPTAQEMRRLLQAEDLEPATGEPPDHLCVELDYLRRLLAQGREIEASRFAAEVMRPWLGRFRDSLATADPPRLFAEAADLLLATIDTLTA